MRIWLSRPHMGGTEIQQVQRAFESNFIAPIGPQLQQFEKIVAEYIGDGVHCAALSSGTAALHLALRMLDLSSDTQVWVSSMTFAGGVFPIVYERAEPVFFDLNPDSWTICPDLIEEALDEANRKNCLPRAIIPTDLYGQSCDLARLETAAAKFEIPLIVDSAESLGASCGDRKCGSGGDMAILSFNGNKIITTGGGGMLVSHDLAVIDRARFLSTQARDKAPHYEHSTYGYNYRLGNVPAAIGVGQMDVLDQRVARRREIFGIYKDALSSIDGVEFMPEPAWSHGSHWLSTMTIDASVTGVTREDIRLALLEHGIECRPLWKPMHQQPLFEGRRYCGSKFDAGLFKNGLCLPSGSDMTEGEQNEVIRRIADLLD